MEKWCRTIETWIDATFGIGTAAQLGPDPYLAMLGGTEDHHPVLAILADRLRWDWRGLDARAQELGKAPDCLRVECAMAGICLAWSNLEQEQTVRVGRSWVVDVFHGRQVAVEPWSLAHYRNPVAVLRWFVARAQAYAVEGLPEIESEAVEYDERHVPPANGWTDDNEATMSAEERDRLLLRLIARYLELATMFEGWRRRLLQALAEADGDPDRVKWPNRMERSRTLAVLRSDPVVKEIAAQLGFRVAA